MEHEEITGSLNTHQQHRHWHSRLSYRGPAGEHQQRPPSSLQDRYVPAKMYAQYLRGMKNNKVSLIPAATAAVDQTLLDRKDSARTRTLDKRSVDVGFVNNGRDYDVR